MLVGGDPGIEEKSDTKLLLSCISQERRAFKQKDKDEGKRMADSSLKSLSFLCETNLNIKRPYLVRALMVVLTQIQTMFNEEVAFGYPGSKSGKESTNLYAGG